MYLPTAENSPNSPETLICCQESSDQLKIKLIKMKEDSEMCEDSHIYGSPSSSIEYGGSTDNCHFPSAFDSLDKTTMMCEED
jgi:hypothetical protein